MVPRTGSQLARPGLTVPIELRAHNRTAGMGRDGSLSPRCWRRGEEQPKSMTISRRSARKQIVPTGQSQRRQSRSASSAIRIFAALLPLFRQPLSAQTACLRGLSLAQGRLKAYRYFMIKLQHPRPRRSPAPTRVRMSFPRICSEHHDGVFPVAKVVCGRSLRTTVHLNVFRTYSSSPTLEIKHGMSLNGNSAC